MKSTRSLRRQLRALWVANLVLFAAVCIAATPAVRPLLLDTSNHPTETVDFASSHWTGDATSGRAINPASVATGGNVTSAAATGNLGTVVIDTSVSFAPAVNLFYGTVLKGQLTAVGDATSLNSPAGVLYLGAAFGQVELNNGERVAFGGSYANLALGSLTASGYLSSDGGAIYSTGTGALYADDLGANGFVTTSGATFLNDDGLTINGQTVVDSAGYLETGQPYSAGAVSPTGYLVLKDSAGTRYRIPAVAAP